MDGHRFDQLARTAAQTRSRRSLVRILLGGALGAGAFATREAAARRKCRHGKVRCNGQCAALLTDPFNCGICGFACAGGQSCQGGTCVGGGGGCNPTCAGNTPDCCGTTCVDTLSDVNNCGACGQSCAANETCEAGLCSRIVPPDRCLDVGVCNTPPPSCGKTAPGLNDCSCQVTTDGSKACINFLDTCDGLRACTSTDGPEDTSCRNLVGFHFFCQVAQTDAQGRPCGCGQVCVPECDNPNPSPPQAAGRRRASGQPRLSANLRSGGGR